MKKYALKLISLILILIFIMVFLVLYLQESSSNQKNTITLGETNLKLTYPAKLQTQQDIDINGQLSFISTNIYTPQNSTLTIAVQMFEAAVVESSTGGGYVRPAFSLSEKFTYVGNLDGRSLYRARNETDTDTYNYYIAVSDDEVANKMDIFNLNGDWDEILIALEVESDDSYTLEDFDKIVLSLSQ